MVGSKIMRFSEPNAFSHTHTSNGDNRKHTFIVINLTRKTRFVPLNIPAPFCNYFKRALLCYILYRI